MKRISVILNLVIILFSSVSFAQNGSSGMVDAKAVAMGRTYTASSRGVYALGINPGNIGLSEQKHFEIQSVLPLPFLGLSVGTDFLSINEFNYYFGGETDASGNKVGRYLTQDDKDKLKTLFEGGGLFAVDLSVQLFAVTYKVSDITGAFGFNISDIMAANINFPSDIVNLGLAGNPIGRVYNFNETDIKAWYLRKYGFTYARDFKIIKKWFRNFNFGVSLNLVSGYFFVGTERFNTNISINENREFTGTGDMLAYTAFSPDFGVKYDFDSLTEKKNFSATPFSKPAGSGFGFDFGFTAEINDIWAMGMSFTDLGSINWTENVAEYSSNKPLFLDDPTEKSQLDSLKDNIKGKGKFTGEYSTPLPGAFRFGLTFQLDKALNGKFPGTFLLAFDYNQGFNDMPRNTTNPRFSIGMDWKIANWVPYLRAGFTFGGIEGFAWSAGMGIVIGALEMNFATPDFHYWFMPASAKRVAFAFDSRWRF